MPVCVALGELIAWGMSRLAEANDEIAEGEASVRQLFDEAPIGIAKLGVDGRFLEVNRAYGDILGYDPADLVGMSAQMFTYPEDRGISQDYIDRLLRGELEQFKYEKRYVHADGHVVWASVNGSAVRNAQGEPLFLIGQIEDITERRQLQRRAGAPRGDGPAHRTAQPRPVHGAARVLRSVTPGRPVGSVALMFLDLDRFKLVNDGIGHDAGDRLLRRVGQRLHGALRNGDVLARFGGDEFTVLCEVAGLDDVEAVVARLRASMSTPVVEPDFEQFVTLSIGVALSHVRRHGPVGAAPVRRHRHVPGQDARSRSVRDLRGARRGRRRPQPPDVQRAPPGGPGEPAGAALPALHRRAGHDPGGHRGARPVAAPRPWPAGAGGVHRAGGGVRPDGRPRRLGAARGVSPGRAAG